MPLEDCLIVRLMIPSQSDDIIQERIVQKAFAAKVNQYDTSSEILHLRMHPEKTYDCKCGCEFSHSNLSWLTKC